MVDRVEHELAVAGMFILPSRRARFLEVINARAIKMDRTPTPKELKRRRNYREVMANLEHWFDPVCEQLPINSNDQHSEARVLLARLGVTADPYVMSEAPQLDGEVMDLDEALSHLDRRTTYGTLLSWAEHGVAYYEQSELASLTRILLAGGHGAPAGGRG